ncbi:SMI1/KNR4 family protein [Streptomyces flavidovirens]
MSEYLDSVFRMLGAPKSAETDDSAWRDIEQRFGLVLPGDYKAFIDAYAPVVLNWHLHFDHPASERWNLGVWMQETVEAYEGLEWDDLSSASFADGGPSFGSGGLIPAMGSDRGECVFLSPGDGEDEWRIVVYVGSDDDFYEYPMGFGEWLYRYLMGEEVAGPNSSAFYPGPVRLQSLPDSPEDRPMVFYGPDRGA